MFSETDCQLFLCCPGSQTQAQGDVEGDLKSLVQEGQYTEALTLAFAQKLLSRLRSHEGSVVESFNSAVEEFTSNGERWDEVLYIGIAALQLFVQSNWTGPPVDLNYSALIPSNQSTADEGEAGGDLETKCRLALAVSGDSVYGLAAHLPLLLLARTIFTRLRSTLTDSSDLTEVHRSWLAWHCRAVWAHQGLLEDPSPALKDELLPALKMLLSRDFSRDQSWSRYAGVALHVEAYYWTTCYHEVELGSQVLQTAVNLSGVNVHLTGVMGKRTRYQESDKAQLVLASAENVAEEQREDLPDLLPHWVTDELPLDKLLGDDTVLERMELQGGGDVLNPLNALQQAVVLAHSMEHKRTHARHTSTDEELMAFMTGLLARPRCWGVQTVALLHRCRLEHGSSRRAERTLNQLEELSCQARRETPPPLSRLQLLWTTPVPPSWSVDRELGAYLRDLGLVNAALEVYERLQMWDEVAACLCATDRKDRAQELIKERLAVEETPLLWCYLGDVTRDHSCYLKAWELSKGHSARAMRSLALLHLAENNVAESRECFKKSLGANPMQLGSWFTYGYALMRDEIFDEAAAAFRRCCLLEPDNFEAWNNLSACYVQVGNKPRALQTLQEALKSNFENWRIWDNILVVSCECKEWELCIRAYNVLLTLRNGHMDTEVLGRLALATIKRVPDPRGATADQFKPRLLKLFHSITASSTTNSEFWKIYGELSLDEDPVTAAVVERACSLLQKSYTCASQEPGWERDLEKSREVADLALSISQVYLDYQCHMTDKGKRGRFLASCRLMLRSLLTKLQQQYMDPHGLVLPQIADHVQKLNEKLTAVTELIASSNS